MVYLLKMGGSFHGYVSHNQMVGPNYVVSWTNIHFWHGNVLSTRDGEIQPPAKLTRGDSGRIKPKLTNWKMTKTREAENKPKTWPINMCFVKPKIWGPAVGICKNRSSLVTLSKSLSHYFTFGTWKILRLFRWYSHKSPFLKRAEFPVSMSNMTPVGKLRPQVGNPWWAAAAWLSLCGTSNTCPNGPRKGWSVAALIEDQDEAHSCFERV